MPANASFDKGAAIEEWTDTHFFRPIGLRIARVCFPTGISPDHVTLMALVTGLVAGRLCFYADVRLNALGVVMFVVSDIFDSADGQLARMRGTSTRFGKILDGLSDGARFANLYIQLIARLLVAGGAWWLVLPIGVLAGLAHARQSAAVDVIRQLYMYLAEGGGEFNLAEDMDAAPAPTLWSRFQVAFYRNYLDRTSQMLPRSVQLIRRLRDNGQLSSVSAQWAQLQRPVVRQCAWIGQNIRFAILAVTVVPGHPMAFLLVTLVPMSCVLIMIVMTHERRAAILLQPGTSQLTELPA
jgi:phosphatidylglycerophosphate synthase